MKASRKKNSLYTFLNLHIAKKENVFVDLSINFKKYNYDLTIKTPGNTQFVANQKLCKFFYFKVD